jgi:cobalt-precorrin-5B (C1)-methyltransferase
MINLHREITMFDPINNFRIPQEWIKRAKVQEAELDSLISSGLYVLLSDGSLLKRGFSTGTTASAAAKASVLSLKKDVREVSVSTPIGIRVSLGVNAKDGRASAIKESGDHASDVTAGMEVTAFAREHDDIVIEAGKGIGSRKGRPAISSSPMRQIEDAVREAVVEAGLRGVRVTISVPRGEDIANLTLNKKVGITGGLSILGTTGFVEPWNEHLGEMKEELIRSADKLVLTTGRKGLRFSHLLFPDREVILVGKNISGSLAAARGEVIIAGLPGIILKWAFPDILEGCGYLTVGELVEGDPENPLIDRALEMAVALSGRRVILFNRNGTILRDSGEPE